MNSYSLSPNHLIFLYLFNLIFFEKKVKKKSLEIALNFSCSRIYFKLQCGSSIYWIQIAVDENRSKVFFLLCYKLNRQKFKNYPPFFLLSIFIHVLKILYLFVKREREWEKITMHASQDNHHLCHESKQTIATHHEKN